MTRRGFIASATTLGLGACTCATAPSIPEPDLAALRAPSNLLAPSRINASLRLTDTVVDAHCHIFNASDVQVGGFLAGPLANDLPEVVRKLVRLLAPIVEAFAQGKAISAYDEMLQLDDLVNQLRSPGSLVSSTPEGVLDAAIESYRRQLADELAAEIRANPEIAGELDRVTGRPAGFTAGDRDNLRQFIFTGLSADQRTPDPAALGAPDDPAREAGGVFTFIGHMLAPRFHNLRSYQKIYATDTTAIGVDQCLASLVDMDYWLGSCAHPPSLLRDQILLNQRLANLADGTLVPLVAYNPWTDIEDGGESIALVRDAIRKRGFKGVKIYPPLGYFPYGNAGSGLYPATGRRPDLTLLDDRLNALFEECRALDVPVMAHAAESMGQRPGHEILSGPDGWTGFFSKPDNRRSWINLAHAGGEDGGGNQRNWTAEFVELMKIAPRLHADLGYWDRFVAGDPGAAERLKELLYTPLGDGQTASDRFMFGTDWFMLTTQRGYQNYPVQFQYALRALGVDDVTMEKIFSGNVKRLFKL